MNAAALSALGERFAGEVLLPSSDGYDEARVVWNAMIDRRPAIVVRPTGAADVIEAIRFAREQDLLVAVRSGGHSIPGLSTCDGGIVIDMSRMRGARVDPRRRVARVNGGALLAELDHEAQAFGLVCPVGVVSHTGVAGLALGAGMGRLQRRFGLTIDNIRSVDLVTADGRLVHAGRDENPDLFWGVRGAGSNFGIATSFEFDLHPFDGAVTAGTVVHRIERAHELAAVFSQLSESGAAELMPTFAIALALPAEEFPPDVAGRPIAAVKVVHSGTPEQAAADLAPLRAVGGALLDTIGPTSYLATQHENDVPMAWGHRMYMKSGFMAHLPAEVVDTCIAHVLDTPPGAECGVSIWAWGGAIANEPEEASAFTGRGAAYWLATEAMWDDPGLDDAQLAWGRTAMAELEPFTMGGHYVNDMCETGEDVVRSIYGDAKYERLLALKREWDPDNVFRLNQNIVP